MVSSLAFRLISFSPSFRPVITSRTQEDGNVEKCINSSVLEGMDHFAYLGAKIQRDGDHSKKTKSRLAMGIKALNGMRKLWKGLDKRTKQWAL